MYRILIADDKSLIRQGIISMIDWEAMDCTLAGEAENGREAIRLIEEKRPDIVITDIRMPLVDGLKILDYVNEQGIALETIVISGYDRFEYVHHALKSSSVDYILKPIHADELNKAVQTACERISKRRKDGQSGNLEQERTLLLSALHGKKNNAFSELAGNFGLPSAVGFCVAVLHNSYKDYLYIEEKILSSALKSAVFADAGETLELVFPMDSAQEIDAIRQTMTQLCAEITTAQRRGLHVGISTFFPASASLQEGYQQAQKALTYKILLPDQRILLYSDLHSRQDTAGSPKEIEKHLLDYLTSGNAEQAITICREFIDRGWQPADCTLEGFVSMMTQLYCILLKIDTEYARQLHSEIQNLNQPEMLLRYESASQLADIFFGYCRAISNELINNRSDSHALIEDIKQYITAHFREPLSLATLEEIFHHNAAYLSVLFKKENGTGFNKYVRQLRLEYAADLLASTDHRLIHICELSGFSNYIHFSKVFKEYFEMSPSEYRKEKHGGEDITEPQ